MKVKFLCEQKKGCCTGMSNDEKLMVTKPDIVSYSILFRNILFSSEKLRTKRSVAWMTTYLVNETMLEVYK